jgi:hypothetical protein
MKIYDVEQGSQEWIKLRLGRPTASNFKRIVTSQGKFSKSCERYIDQLRGEAKALYLPSAAEKYTSKAVQWGIETEAEARRWFQMESGYRIQKIGFITTDDGRFGCSPDGFVIGHNGDFIGGLELKCPEPEAHSRWQRQLAQGIFPSEHVAQVHGGLMVSNLPAWWFVSYCPGLDPINSRITPDEYTDELRVALERFWMRFQEIEKLCAK